MFIKSGGQSFHNRTRIGQDYYDESADAVERQAYYSGLADKFQLSSGTELFSELGRLVSQTHRPNGELPGDHLYAVVDRRPDGALYNLYSGEGPKNEEQAKERNARDLEGYNLEHVVPKSWFDAQRPMRDDLHHLFTEDRKCNSDRGNLPFDEVDSKAGNSQVLPSCGYLRTTHGKAFEPSAGKGEVARAILYFVTRYPGEIGDQHEEMTRDDIAKLISWHKEFPVTDYERHRNETIQDWQGNRNPYIDFPELVEKVDFRAGFAS